MPDSIHPEPPPESRALAALRPFQFQKGKSGNPGGRVPSDLTKLLSQFVQKNSEGGKGTWKARIIERVVALAVKGDMEAVKFIWDRLEGKAALSVAITGSVGVFTPEMLRDLVQAYHDSKQSRLSDY